MATRTEEKDPNSVEPYFIVWCSDDGTNDGGAGDSGELQGATISNSTWINPSSSITVDSNNTSAVTIRGVTYAANTVATVWVSGGIHGVEYPLTNRVVLSDGRTLDKTIIIPVEDNI